MASTGVSAVTTSTGTVTIPAAATIPITATALHRVSAIVVGLAHFEELGGDRIGQVERNAVVKVDALFPGIEGVDSHHAVRTGLKAAGLYGV